MPLWSALLAGLPLSIHAVVFYRNEREANRQWLWECRKASSEGCCTTGSCQVHVVVTAFGGIWQRLLLPSHGWGLPFSWLKCFGSAQLLLEHCTLNTVTAGDRAMVHCEVQGLWFRSRNGAMWLSWTTNLAELLLDYLQGALHDTKLSCSFAKACFNHCQEWM